MKITGEAVEAAVAAAVQTNSNTAISYQAMEAALEAALLHLSQGAVRVKPLEWKELSTGWIAHTSFHAYEVVKTDHGFMATYANRDFAWGTEDAMKAAAQADYERRALSTLSPAPVGVMDDDEGSMTPEEIRLENLKQMAAFDGPIVSFKFQEPYYLASCDRCGWVGSSERCGTDSWGDDSDVHCPRCFAGGADCGKVAAALASHEPAPRDNQVDLSVMDDDLINRLRHRVNNPSAWVAFDQEGSDLFEKAVRRLEALASHEPALEMCATDGCENRATHWRGKFGVGAFYCEPCDGKIAAGIAKEPAPTDTQEGVEWQPIETAPKGSEMLLAYAPPSNDFPDARTIIVKGSILASMMAEGTPNHLAFPATHWMPLPVPPTTMRAEAQEVKT